MISELVRPVADGRVLAWVARQPPRDLVTASVVAAELRFGIANLSYGERRRGLGVALQYIFAGILDRPGLPFDDHCVPHFATFVAKRQRMGRPVQGADGFHRRDRDGA